MMKMPLSANMQAVLLLLPLLAPSNAILPELVHPGIHLILDNSSQEEERAAIPVQQETNLATATVQPTELDNHIDTGCVTAEDCGKERYCLHENHNSRCKPCKGIDVSCTEDEECCSVHLCVWGQCSPNATKGQAGSTCQLQSHCSPDLCCAIHAALLFPVCSAKPIERERCFPASNHLTEDDTPRKHCPCAGDLHCQHLGRGSMCLRAVDSSEEGLTDSLYSAIDYIL
ncbi:dickkopf-related protein 3a [Phyllopteryx taeniolatus]|uniref:dickkopf-related protein 3a n=1 Tax=Phyllopteryx taeniolatus TaxID=161469 RepID=UPI002AD571F1|nr:dickkopf-related protein 3a [Phyllopteryx taeniolatus]XP_061610041.1 dickkopf-related protein 3a [Phyllopteryx taeniolatus]XP_061610050.1 dickkopf-related protein 3a [Phyllopteryx taeniolatus]XP_061610060.1 dickkopf-related protein 3a [Phyllopteryx taeniolatus]XP_061610068.1 dickkopf-related protein 3a [Phyllopteryx taeniolatus]XP_061610077.1 dickkopf-related protein 3a [Phyllopteryx taeniolatus]XP_061610085.1 dickkopf-related protein 3a [Phyllopteryx taeniolatus]XP_061610095.1 dickkopf-r